MNSTTSNLLRISAIIDDFLDNSSEEIYKDVVGLIKYISESFTINSDNSKIIKKELYELNCSKIQSNKIIYDMTKTTISKEITRILREIYKGSIIDVLELKKSGYIIPSCEELFELFIIKNKKFNFMMSLPH